jgi:hypothetical protein
LSLPVVGEGLLYLLLGVHHKGAMLHNRLTCILRITYYVLLRIIKYLRIIAYTYCILCITCYVLFKPYSHPYRIFRTVFEQYKRSIRIHVVIQSYVMYRCTDARILILEYYRHIRHMRTRMWSTSTNSDTARKHYHYTSYTTILPSRGGGGKGGGPLLLL